MTIDPVWLAVLAPQRNPASAGPERQPRPDGAQYRPTRDTYVHPVPSSTPAVVPRDDYFLHTDPTTPPPGRRTTVGELREREIAFVWSERDRAWWPEEVVRFTAPTADE